MSDRGWEKTINGYKEEIRVWFSSVEIEKQPPDVQHTRRRFRAHILAMLDLIEQIQAQPEFSDIVLSTWHAGLFLGIAGKFTRVGIWYEATEDSYYIFGDGNLSVSTSADEQVSVGTVEEAIDILKHRLRELRDENS
ncbi:MAG: hypothetical protein GX573_20805 [Chloroflexi bacterium]|nr:hypothetical protein [Chloroflexota bacterium]